MEGRTSKCAIWGLGGVGKTQVLLELVYRTRDKYPNCSILWIPATDRESLHQGYLNVANKLGIPVSDNKADVKLLVQAFLSEDSAGQWLLVFDNADEIDMWIPWGAEHESDCLIDRLPRSKHGSIVFTTRDRNTAVKLAQQSIVDVSQMDEDIATQLLQKCVVNQDLADQDTKSLLIHLTYLPLAIVQAASYINENGISLVDYLLLLERQEEEVIDLLSEEFEDDGRYRNIKNPVATTWFISFKKIQQRDPLAADYLSFMACVGSKDIPLSLLPPGPSPKKETDAIGLLNAYSFIQKQATDKTCSIHRLVHLATRNWLRQRKLLVQWTERAMDRLEEVFPNNGHQNRSSWRRLLTHAHFVLESNITDQYKKTRIYLAAKCAGCLHSDGRWKEAETLQIQVIEANKRVLGKEHRTTLLSRENLTLIFMGQGRWEEAENLQIQVLEAQERVLGQEHPITLISKGNLALVFMNQGRWKEAENLLVQVVEAHKRVLGPEHPITLNSKGCLASAIMNQGRLEEAESLVVQVLEARKEVLGPEHPFTLTTMSNLACSWKHQGRDIEALQLMSRCLEISRKVLGVNHPDFLDRTRAYESWAAK